MNQNGAKDSETRPSIGKKLVNFVKKQWKSSSKDTKTALKQPPNSLNKDMKND